MPCVFRIKNIKFYIYFNDHGKPHVHVITPIGELKVDIETLDLIGEGQFREKDLRFILKIVEENREDFLEAWSEYNE